ncbi:MAG TPA: Tim44/TimA family putative adaptor protein [Acetobacteraceae bacterium]|nr:Tim44/TimA family putative adaptor protein [Acetobacteraceae bacterium]
MGQSGFPIDLVLFGLIAAFLVLRLRSVLGRRTGFERPPLDTRGDAQGPRPPLRSAPVIEGRAEAVPPAPARPLPDPASPVGATLVRMQGVDRGFEPQRFLEGAEQAFRIIVAAFAAGDRDALRPLLSEETYRTFDTAIAERESRGETQKTEIRSIEAASIESAELAGTTARIAVRFVSDQVNVTFGRDGQPATGTEAVTEITDLWTFERDLAARDPTWRLVGARSA